MAQYPYDAPTPDEPITGLLFRLCSWAFGWGTGIKAIKVNADSDTASWHTENAAVASGVGFVALGSMPASVVQLVNNTGKTLDVQRAGDTGFVQLPTSAFQTIPVVSNTNEITVRTSDSSGAATGFGWYVFD